MRVQKAEMTGFDEDKLALFGGQVPEPLDAGWHNPPVMEAALDLGMKAETWGAVDDGLKSFAHKYAEAMSSTPVSVTDELSARLLEALGAAGLIELTAYIAFSNFSTRNNVALGIESQGFSSDCEIPLATVG